MAPARKVTRKKSATKDSALTLTQPTASAVQHYGELFDPNLTTGASGAEAGLAPFISTEDGVMRVQNNEIGKVIDVVILGAAVDHALYPGAYRKGQPNNPICFYVGPSEADAKPDPASSAPQHADCAGCVKNAFGSGTGNAKACRQSRRLLILPYGPNTDVEQDQLFRLRVPPTSIKHLSGYFTKLNSYKRPLQTVVTRIEFKGHSQNRFEVTFTPLSAIDDREVLTSLARRANEGKEALFAVPIADRGKKKGSGKTTGGGAADRSGRRKVVRRR